jgi:hypothetical protein
MSMKDGTFFLFYSGCCLSLLIEVSAPLLWFWELNNSSTRIKSDLLR